jgi:Ca-activated chloride channel family protein
MSFGEPWFLLGLLALPLLGLAYAQHQRDRRAAAAAFAAPALQPAVTTGSPGWRRHVPPAAYGLALLVLLLALAKPQRSVAVPVERASIMLVTDYSGSMESTDVPPNRLAAARDAAARFLEKVPGRIRVGLVVFNQNARTLQTPTTDRQAVVASLGALVPSGGTATGEAMSAALSALQRQVGDDGTRAPGAIVLLSDGESTRGRSPESIARRARRLRIPVYTVALGTAQGTIRVRVRGRTETRRVPPDPQAMREVARISRGQAFATADPDRLSAVYEQLGSRIGRRDEERQMTSGFAGGALALLVAGATLSVLFFRRVP